MKNDYFAVEAVSVSGINAYCRSPAHYWRYSPYNPNKKEMETTPAMLFGKVSHKLALEREKFSQEFAICPSVDRRTKEGKATWEEFNLRSDGKTVIKEEMYDEAMLLADSLHRNTDVTSLIRHGISEQECFWERENDFGVIKCKAKFDYCRDGLLIDYKTSTCAAEDDFTKSLATYGYHRQAAWYMDAVERTTGQRPQAFVLIVQEKDLPEAISIYAVDDYALQIGHEENEAALRCITKRLNTGDWTAYHSGIKAITLPGWYRSKINNLTNQENQYV
jgi:exodeoxyribonuclease VIII